VWLALALLWLARSVFVLTFLGVLFGVTLAGGTTWLERRGVPRAVGTLLQVVALVGLLVGLGAVTAPQITRQGQELQQQLPDALDRVDQWLQERQGGLTDLLQSERADSTGKQGPSPDLRQTLAQQFSRIGASFFGLFSSTLSVLAGLLVVTFVAVYLAIDPRTYRRGLMHLVPHRARRKASEVLDATGVALRRWLVAQFVAMLVIGALTTVALLLIGVRAAVALGIIAGLLEFVPYAGPILSAVPAVAMAFLDGPDKALWVVVAYIAIQQVENNALIPLLMKEGLELPPVLTLVGQVALAAVFGFGGLLIAVPLLGAIMVPIKLLYVQDVVGDEVSLPGDG
jgi:predicted PurR-regulated permease PerM